MSVEAAPRALIWSNDTSSSKKGRKVSHLRNVSIIHSVRKSKRLSEKRDNDKPDAKASSEPEAVAPPAGQPLPAAPSASSAQPRTSTQSRRTQQPADTAETRSETQGRGVPRAQPRETETTIRGRTQVHTSPQPTKLSDSLQESRNGTATTLQKRNSLSQMLRRVIFSASATLRKQYSRHTSMTLTRTTETSSISNRGCMNHHGAEACGGRDHTPWRKSYTNMTPRTRDYAVTLVQQMTTSTRITRTHSTNI